ncbi:MAG: septum formation initiator family protein [Elusimicrobiota bacterium]
MPKKSKSRKNSGSDASRWTFDRIPRAWLYAGAALAAAAFLLGNQGFRKAASNFLLLRRIERTDAELLREEARLYKELIAARSDDHALEDAARGELGYLKPGEVEYRFPPPGKEKK